MEQCIEQRESITYLLQEWQRGNQDAGERLIFAVFTELRKISNAYLRKERQTSLQPTELVNEAFIRMVDQKEIRWEDRVHFFGIAAKLMRQILVERLRKRTAQKRGGDGDPELAFDEEITPADSRPLDLIKLDDALKALEKVDPRKCRLVELRFFAGLTIEETAAALEISPATVKREWLLAKAWLRRHMTGT